MLPSQRVPIVSCPFIHFLCGLLFNIVVLGFDLVKNPTIGHLLILLSSNLFLVSVLKAIAVPGVQYGQEPLLYIKKNH